MHDEVENVVMNESNVGECGKVKKEQKLKSTVMDGVKNKRGEL